MQLTDFAEQFKALGFGVATITYDSTVLLKEVELDEGISFKMLSDKDVRVVNAFGIRNLDYEPGHRAYGIPYPGILLRMLYSISSVSRFCQPFTQRLIQ